ncbi:hypothetical protein FGO68_gene10607 [Halteria grandinella]|uniref:peptidylprolyl isomerase n=1 Tax=Halteria grandinella TaxID=5974 RepID=A0A8J8P4N3_HALGN|nr:hypothetical protein FGO68_gene10607 [Halteria grandinella]
MNKINKEDLIYDNFYKKVILDILEGRKHQQKQPQNAQAKQPKEEEYKEFKVIKLNEGTGPTCPPGAQAKVHYTGKLTSGKKFDSSLDRNRAFGFKVGQGQVIKCWDEGFQQLQKGQKAVLHCPPDYAYGDRGFPGAIPPNSFLIFEVELLDFTV